MRKVLSEKEHLEAMQTAELLTFEEAMAALRNSMECGTSSLWPTLNGNEIYAFANAAAALFRSKDQAARGGAV